MKKFIPILLVIAMMIPFISCTIDPDGAAATTDDEVTTDPVTSEAVPETIDLKEFKIIRPDGESAAYLAYYTKFYSDFKTKTGYKDIIMTDDFIKAGTVFAEAKYEILLGATNRAESKAALEGRKKTEYVIEVVGTKLVINAGTRLALEYVLDLFMTRYLESGSTVIPADLSVRGDYDKDSYFPELEGLTIAAMGDSYFGNDKENVWIKLMADEYGMKLYNYGIGGSTISNYVTEKHPMCDRISDMKGGADIVLFEGGRNDYNVKAPIGELSSRDTKTLAGAINVSLDQLIAKYPDAMLICVTAWYVNDAMQPYVRTMIDICKERGIRCFNASNQAVTGVYMNDPYFRAKYCLTETDVSHLNPEGMKLVEPVFENYIGTEYKKFLEEKNK